MADDKKRRGAVGKKQNRQWQQKVNKRACNPKRGEMSIISVCLSQTVFFLFWSGSGGGILRGWDEGDGGGAYFFLGAPPNSSSGPRVISLANVT